MFYKQPVCHNPGTVCHCVIVYVVLICLYYLGQYVLPGGKMNKSLLRQYGTLEATMKQFTEESGVSWHTLEKLHYSDDGYYTAPENVYSDTHCDINFYYIHFVKVDGVDVIVEEANDVLRRASAIVNDSTMNTIQREACLKALHEETGFNDDAAEKYIAVSMDEALGYLQRTISFEDESREEWEALVREQCLFFSYPDRDAKIVQVLSDPGFERDWQIAGLEYFLNNPV